jgi:hypothetical protein
MYKKTAQVHTDKDRWARHGLCEQVDSVDIWTNHTPYPFNQLPKTYSFMVRNSLIWRIGYYGQQPRFIHVPTQTVSSLFVSKQVGQAFDHYQPDMVVSVHPLMQLVPLRVLRQQARWMPVVPSSHLMAWHSPYCRSRDVMACSEMLVATSLNM